MLAWALTDSQAKNIYNALYKWYDSPSNFPNYQTGAGVFFGFANYTRDKLYYTIEAAKKYYSLGWFTDNFDQRNAAMDKLSSILYDVFAGQVEKAGIKKFLTWIYNFAKSNESAVKYFSGVDGFNVLDTAAVVLDEVAVKPIKSVAENVSYAVSYPSLKSLLPDNITLLKWGLIIGGGLYVWKFLENRTKRI
jgi:hypothetical protein